MGKREGAGRELREFRVWPRFNHRPVGNRTDCRLAQFLVYNVCSGYNGIPTLDGAYHFYSGTSTIIMYESEPSCSVISAKYLPSTVAMHVLVW